MKEEDNQFIMNILTDENKRVQTGMHRIVVAGTGYVGLSLAVLLSQYNQVTAVDIIPEKVKKLNNYIFVHVLLFENHVSFKGYQADLMQSMTSSSLRTM